MNCMKQTFSNAMSESSHQSIDESMVKLKGRSVLKQYLLLKPIKRGVKVWQRCDAQNGYIFDPNIYAGKTENDEFSEGTLGERVATKLCSTIKISDVVLSFDRFFASVNLVHTLTFSAVGTVIKSRKNVPKFEKHLENGESEFLATSSGIVPRMFYTIPGVAPPLCSGVVPPLCCAPPQVLCPAVPRTFYIIPQLNTFTKFRWMFLVCYLKLLDSSFLFFVERHFYVECYWDI